MENHHTTLTNFDNTFCEFLPGLLPETFQLSHISLHKPPKHLNLLLPRGNYIIVYLTNNCQQPCNCYHKLVCNRQVFYRSLECDCESVCVIRPGQHGYFAFLSHNNYTLSFFFQMNYINTDFSTKWVKTFLENVNDVAFKIAIQYSCSVKNSVWRNN